MSAVTNTPKHRGKPTNPVCADARLPKLEHRVFDGTWCKSIKETEGLTGSQIKALNLSICVAAAQSQAAKGSEWETD